MSVTLPITLTPVPAPVTVKCLDFNQTVTAICSYIQASVNTKVSFFDTVTVDPTVMTTPLIYNSTQNAFKAWDTGRGRYRAITQYQPGDIKNTFVGGDSPQTGWIVCDGRKISDVIGISQNQQGVLNQLFGVGGSLPTMAAIQSVSGLPAANAFSGITVSDTTPPANQIGNLPFSGSYTAVEEQNLASNTETLRGSQDTLRTAVAAIQGVADKMLNAFAAPASTMVSAVFVDYP